MLIFFQSIKSLSKNFYKRIIQHTSSCRIEEINLDKKTVIIHNAGTCTPIKLTLDEIINDLIILENLPLSQTAWLGYYYGKYYRELLDRNSDCNKFYNFIIDESQGLYTIMLNRQGNVVYSTHDGSIIHTISPINALINKKIIAKFTPTQACYIGIIAGMNDLKKPSKKNPTDVSYLRLVK